MKFLCIIFLLSSMSSFANKSTITYLTCPFNFKFALDGQKIVRMKINLLQGMAQERVIILNPRPWKIISHTSVDFDKKIKYFGQSFKPSEGKYPYTPSAEIILHGSNADDTSYTLIISYSPADPYHNDLPAHTADATATLISTGDFISGTDTANCSMKY